MKKPLKLFVTLATVLALAACSGGAEEANDPKISIGMFPVVDATPAQAALINDIFEKNGLEVTIVETAGGAQGIPSLMAKEFDIAFSNYPSMILAAEQGLPLVVASGNNVGNGDHTVMVPEASSIASAKDLEGKKVAVSHLKNIGVLSINSAVAADGGDPSKVTYVEIPFPDMEAALDRGDVDAMWMIEPFMAKAKDAGKKIVVDNFSGDFSKIPVSGWVTTKEFAERNPESLAAFSKSIDEASSLINSDKDAMKEAVQAFTEIDEAVLDQMVLPTWTGKTDEAGLKKVSDAMTEFQFIDGDFDVATILPK